MKYRLDKFLVEQKLVSTRSQAETYIRLGQVKVDGKSITKPGFFVGEESKIEFGAKEQYVSRAALKLASVSDVLGLNFKDKVVLDVGSSTGGFTDYALQHGADKVIAVDVGTDQLHPRLRADPRVELHEKTNILDVRHQNSECSKDEKSSNIIHLTSEIGLVLIDVSFVSLKKLLPHIATIINSDSQIVAMLKPQFEAGKGQLNKGIVKNSAQRRDILQDFETWCRQSKFVVVKKSDSAIAGSKGNVERFYLLQIAR